MYCDFTARPKRSGRSRDQPRTDGVTRSIPALKATRGSAPMTRLDGVGGSHRAPCRAPRSGDRSNHVLCPAAKSAWPSSLASSLAVATRLFARRDLWASREPPGAAGRAMGSSRLRVPQPSRVRDAAVLGDEADALLQREPLPTFDPMMAPRRARRAFRCRPRSSGRRGRQQGRPPRPASRCRAAGR